MLISFAGDVESCTISNRELATRSAFMRETVRDRFEIKLLLSSIQHFPPVHFLVQSKDLPQLPKR